MVAVLSQVWGNFLFNNNHYTIFYRNGNRNSGEASGLKVQFQS
jgi:hypothetical protein